MKQFNAWKKVIDTEWAPATDNVDPQWEPDNLANRHVKALVKALKDEDLKAFQAAAPGYLKELNTKGILDQTKAKNPKLVKAADLIKKCLERVGKALAAADA